MLFRSNKTAPHVIESIHRDYLEAGADIIETNSFGSTDLVLDDYDLGHEAEELSYLSATLAKKAAADYSSPSWPRFVAGAMGPTTKSLSVTGGTTFGQLIESYYIQARGLIRGRGCMINVAPSS